MPSKGNNLVTYFRKWEAKLILAKSKPREGQRWRDVASLSQHTSGKHNILPFEWFHSRSTLPKTRQELQVQPQDKLSLAAEMLLLPISQTAASYLHSLTSDTAAGGGGCSVHWMTRAISAWSPSPSCARTWAAVNPRSQVSEAKPSRGISVTEGMAKCSEGAGESNQHAPLGNHTLNLANPQYAWHPPPSKHQTDQKVESYCCISFCPSYSHKAWHYWLGHHPGPS